MAQKAIRSAYVESHCAEYGVGIVKLFGKFSGILAMEASLASIDVNICLVPEFGFEIHGANGLLQYICQRLRIKRHCVIVVAEGASKDLIFNFFFLIIRNVKMRLCLMIILKLIKFFNSLEKLKNINFCEGYWSLSPE